MRLIKSLNVFLISLACLAPGISLADSTSLKTNANQTVAPTPTQKFQTFVNFFPSSAASGGISGHMYVANQNCNGGWLKYSLSNGAQYITLPYSGTYVISYYIQAYNNNGGSVEWNNLQFHLNYMPPGQTNQLLPNNEGQMTVSQSGGGCNSCSQYNTSYLWWSTIPPTYFPAGTQIWISGEVASSGTNCGGNSVLIEAGGLGITQQ